MIVYQHKASLQAYAPNGKNNQNDSSAHSKTIFFNTYLNQKKI